MTISYVLTKLMIEYRRANVELYFEKIQRGTQAPVHFFTTQYISRDLLLNLDLFDCTDHT